MVAPSLEFLVGIVPKAISTEHGNAPDFSSSAIEGLAALAPKEVRNTNIECFR
jgi:hypothetical protein